MLTLEKIAFQTHPIALAAAVLEEIENLWPKYRMQLDLDGCYCLTPQEMKRLGLCDARFGDPVQSTDLKYLVGYLQGIQELPRRKDGPVFLERPEKTVPRYWSEDDEF